MKSLMYVAQYINVLWIFSLREDLFDVMRDDEDNKDDLRKAG